VGPHLRLLPFEPRSARVGVQLSGQVDGDALGARELFCTLSHQHHVGSTLHYHSCQRDGMRHAPHTRHTSRPATPIHNRSIQRNNPVSVGVAAQAHAVLAAVALRLHHA
jgi:hypothetical protein